MYSDSLDYNRLLGQWVRKWRSTTTASMYYHCQAEQISLVGGPRAFCDFLWKLWSTLNVVQVMTQASSHSITAARSSWAAQNSADATN